MEKVVLVSAVRTPIGKFLGTLAPVSAPKLGALVVREAVARAGVKPDQIDEVYMGNVVGEGLGLNPARHAAIWGGIRDTVPARAVNMVCGDGVIGALQVLALMLRTGHPLSERARGAMQRVPQVLENVTLPARRPLEEMGLLRKAQQRIERTLGSDGRVLVRWSGTEPKLRIMVEGPDAAKIRTFAKDMADAARKDVPAAG